MRRTNIMSLIRPAYVQVAVTAIVLLGLIFLASMPVKAPPVDQGPFDPHFERMTAPGVSI